jgi:putative SOS response-associated peptidase YedK
MCGRFTLRASTETLVEHFMLDESQPIAPRYNIAPSQPVAVVRQPPDAGERTLTLIRWGLIPFWAKDPAIGNRLINARAETVAEKPAFRKAFQQRRCLIAADGYYEWRKTSGGKQPYYFRLKSEEPFAFAGLWESWTAADSGGEPLETCVIITTRANELSLPIHERMPAILQEADYDAWLDPAAKDRRQLAPLLEPYDSASMIADPVSTLVNNPRNDEPGCIRIQHELF